MRKSFIGGAAAFLLFCALFSFASAQTDEERIAELRRQIEALEQQADLYRDNIASEREKADSLKRDIAILKNQISAIESQITATSKKIDRTKIEISQTQQIIFDTQKRINLQREGMGRLLASIQRYDDDSLLAVLIKNSSLADFFRQSQDISSVSQQLIALIGELDEEKAVLEESRKTLEGKQSSLEALNRQNAVQRSSLSGVKNEKNSLLQQTKGQELEYQKRLEEIEKKESEFFGELRTLESKVVAGGLYVVRVKADSIPPKKTKLFQWPENGYYITQKYGCTKYARCNRARAPYGGAPHNGLDMAAGYGSPILAAADGEIIANGINDGWGNWLAIRHPNAYNLVTLYAHMSAFAPLKVGTAVKAGDTIGYEGSTGHVTGSHLHFSVYSEFFTYINEEKKNQLYFNYFEGSLNPQDYL